MITANYPEIKQQENRPTYTLTAKAYGLEFQVRVLVGARVVEMLSPAHKGPVNYGVAVSARATIPHRSGDRTLSLEHQRFPDQPEKGGWGAITLTSEHQDHKVPEKHQKAIREVLETVLNQHQELIDSLVPVARELARKSGQPRKVRDPNLDRQFHSAFGSPIDRFMNHGGFDPNRFESHIGELPEGTSLMDVIAQHTSPDVAKYVQNLI